AFNYISLVPRPLRRVAGRAMTTIPKSAWDHALWRQNRAGERIHKLARIMTTSDEDSMYFELVTHWRDLVTGARERELPLTDRTRWPKLEEPIERMMYFDLISYLPDDIL